MAADGTAMSKWDKKWEEACYATAYLSLLRLPLDSDVRASCQNAMAAIRDKLAEIENCSSEDIQKQYETMA